MSRVSLSDEETYVILAPEFTDSIGALDDKTRQVSVLKRIHTLVSSDAPHRFIYEQLTGCDELEIIRAGSDLRIYCCLVMGVPEGNKRYNVLFCFYVDPHKYNQSDLRRFDAAAKQRVRQIQSFDLPENIAEYLEDHNAFDASGIQKHIERA